MSTTEQASQLSPTSRNLVMLTTSATKGQLLSQPLQGHPLINSSTIDSIAVDSVTSELLQNEKIIQNQDSLSHNISSIDEGEGSSSPEQLSPAAAMLPKFRPLVIVPPDPSSVSGTMMFMPRVDDDESTDDCSDEWTI